MTDKPTPFDTSPHRPSALPTASAYSPTPVDKRENIDLVSSAALAHVEPSELSEGFRASASALGGSASSGPASTTPAAASGQDIEMAPIATGHRRRKSSLVGPSPPIGSPRPYAGTMSDEPGILEERNDSRPRMTERLDSSRDSFSDEDLHDDEEAGLTGKDRIRRQRKRRRNTLLDQRVVREKGLSADEKKDADKSVLKRLFINGTLILLWYLLSLGISMYNKWMFDEDRLNFAFPLFTTSFHMIMQFFLAGLVLFFIPSLRPEAWRKPDTGRLRQETEALGPVMTKMFYATRIAPCGAATGLDIGLGNTSLKFISLTFYTMCKSSSLAFVLIFAFVFRLEQPTWRLVAIIAVMTVGVVLMVFGEVEFELGGFVLVISAAFFAGFRWALTQILLLRNAATSNPFSSIFFLTPIMFVILFSLAIPVEGFVPLWHGLGTLSEAYGVFLTPLLLMFPGTIAFLMTAAEFALLQRTSVVTLSIAGIFKEVVTISAASIVFKDQLTLINLIGLLVTLVAIGAYNYIKITKMRREAQSNTHGTTGAELRNASRTPSTASDIEDDEHHGESAGLLQRTSEDPKDRPLVTSDGDIQPSLFQSQPSTSADGARGRRID